jgi:hypothetical protein
VLGAAVSSAAGVPDRPKPAVSDQGQAKHAEQKPQKPSAPIKPPQTVAKADNKADTKEGPTSEQSAKKPDPEQIKITDWIMAGSAAASTFFAAVLALFTWRLIVVGRDQHRVAREEFNATHRPRIVLRDLALAPPTATRDAVAEFFISNNQEGVATILSCSFSMNEIKRGQKIPEFRGEQRHYGIVGRSLISGERIRVEHTSHINWSAYQNAVNEAHYNSLYGEGVLDDGTIVFEGQVTYADKAGVNRRSSFYRKFDFNRRTFGPGDDPEREYAD